VSVYQIVRPLSQRPTTEEPPAKTRVQQRCDEDYRYCMASCDVDRAIRHIEEFERFEESERYELMAGACRSTVDILRRYKQFLIIDPEAKL
jgi:hypothetical protein